MPLKIIKVEFIGHRLRNFLIFMLSSWTKNNPTFRTPTRKSRLFSKFILMNTMKNFCEISAICHNASLNRILTYSKLLINKNDMLKSITEPN